MSKLMMQVHTGIVMEQTWPKVMSWGRSRNQGCMSHTQRQRASEISKLKTELFEN